ncbi:MAG: ABC transporter substrate-binding protein [Roseivirga sp.]|nr:ABC transporter substrate-binding protein [Roseivirga sp.]
MGRAVRIPDSPKRIVSLVPSQTELLYDLGLGDRVVGITKFCVHPAHWLREKTIVGGTKKFRSDTINALRPDLIIGNKEENYKEGIEQLSSKYPVWMSDIFDFKDALEMIRSVAAICNKATEGNVFADKIANGLKTVEKGDFGKTLYLIWNKPYMAAGNNTFIDKVLELAGFDNCAPGPRYPEISESKLTALNPDHVLLSSEPYPFKEQHIAEVKDLLPDAKVQLVDGEIFSWYGSRLLELPAYLKGLQKEK